MVVGMSGSIGSLMLLIFLSFISSVLMLKLISSVELTSSIFPGLKSGNALFYPLFSFVGVLNLVSLSWFGFAISSCFSFNFSAALFLWTNSCLFLMTKQMPWHVFLPSNAPLILGPFLSMVEILSNFIRPLTLSLRLLVNMSAGHLMLALVCKLPSLFLMMAGLALGVLELLVSLVQSFVFFMLVRVYLEESLNMFTYSLSNIILKK